MSETQEKVIKGGGFLVEDIAAEDMLTPEDFTSEHKMIAKTTEEYVKGEVWPVLDNLENHEFDKSVDLLKKAGELGLLGADVPEEYGGLGLDKVSSSLITEKMSLCWWILHHSRCTRWYRLATNRFLRQQRTKRKISTCPGNW